jgi:hypothetical protein
MAEKRKAKKAKPKRSSKAQARRFVEKARELGVDETGAEFEAAFKKVVTPSRRSNTGSGP